MSTKIAPSDKTKIDYPEGWAKKGGTKGSMYWLPATIALSLAISGTLVLFDVLGPSTEKGNLLGASLLVAGLPLAVLFVYLFIKSERAQSLYKDAFYREIAALAKTRHGINLTERESRHLITPLESGAKGTIDANLENQRVSIELGSLSNGKDIRFYYADTNKELAIATATTSIESKTLVNRDAFDLPKDWSWHVNLIKGSDLVESAWAIGLVLSMMGAVLAALVLPNSPILGAIMIAVLVVSFVTALILFKKDEEKTRVKLEEKISEFDRFVIEHYDLHLSAGDLKLLYAKNSLTTEIDDERLTVRMSTLSNGNDARLIENITEKELPVLP